MFPMKAKSSIVQQLAAFLQGRDFRSKVSPRRPCEPEKTYEIVLPGIFLDDFVRPVARAIADDHPPSRELGLRKHAPDRLFNEGFFVMCCGHQDIRSVTLAGWPLLAECAHKLIHGVSENATGEKCDSKSIL